PRPGGRRKARGGCLITESLLRGLRIQQVRNRLSFELRGVALAQESAPDGMALLGQFALAHSVAPAVSALPDQRHFGERLGRGSRAIAAPYPITQDPERCLSLGDRDEDGHLRGRTRGARVPSDHYIGAGLADVQLRDHLETGSGRITVML